MQECLLSCVTAEGVRPRRESGGLAADGGEAPGMESRGLTLHNTWTETKSTPAGSLGFTDTHKHGHTSSHILGLRLKLPPVCPPILGVINPECSSASTALLLRTTRCFQVSQYLGRPRPAASSAAVTVAPPSLRSIITAVSAPPLINPIPDSSRFTVTAAGTLTILTHLVWLRGSVHGERVEYY